MRTRTTPAAETMPGHGIGPFAIDRDSISPVHASYNDKVSFPFTRPIEKTQFNVTQKRGAGDLEKLRRKGAVLRGAE